MFAGDALTRALTAEAMAGGGPIQVDPDWATPYLVEAFSDTYAIVRFFAARGLVSRDSSPARPDYLAAAEDRHRVLEQWRAAGDPAMQRRVMALAESLAAMRKEVDIEVGE